MDKLQQIEFERIAEQMIEFLRNSCHPHMHVVIDCNIAEISEGVAVFKIDNDH